jgi:hypothetical protein
MRKAKLSVHSADVKKVLRSYSIDVRFAVPRLVPRHLARKTHGRGIISRSQRIRSKTSTRRLLS